MTTSAPRSSPLAGRRVAVTRERPGELGRLLAERGAVVVHVPLISVQDPSDEGEALRTELARLDRYDWLVVTSAPGAERVGPSVRDRPGVRLAGVGTVTARVFAEAAGRPIDVVPQRQIADALADAMLEHIERTDGVGRPQRILIAQADRARPTLADRLSRAGHDVSVVEAYRTVAVRPADVSISDVDAVALASGSAAQSWADAFGTVGTYVVVAIGPTTAAVAERLGLKVTGVATDHSIEGLVEEIERHFTE